MAKKEKEAPKKEKTSKAVMMTLGLLIFTTFSVILAIVYVSQGNPNILSIKEVFAKDPVEQYTKPFEVITNIDIQNEEAKTSYIQTQIVLSSEDEKDFEKIQTKTIPIQDILVRYFNGQTRDTLVDMEKQVQVKENLVDLIQQELEVALTGVYFTNYVIR